MSRTVRLALLVLASLVIFPVAARAQASITGVIRDTSGAVLPGVTVEAASPALIEKVRTAVTDGNGQYRIEDLRPGAYTVTYSLVGFSTIKREGIELSGTFTASINVEMRVGALEETITVTGETPTVDVTNITRQRVLDAQVLEALPATRSIPFVAALTAGVTTQNMDVGGIRGMGPSGAGPGAIFVHGVDDPRLVVNGNSLHSIGTGSGNQGAANMAAYVEIVVDTAGIGAEQKEGGLRMQLIPKDGGNTFNGYFLGAWANSSLASGNYNDDLRSRGLPAPNALKRIWDVNPAIGGPILRDKLWFHGTIRYTGAQSTRALFQNRNAGNPNAWTYDPSDQQEEISNVWRNVNARFTWQATPRNKFGVSYDQAVSEEHPRDPGVNFLTEAGLNQWAQLDPKRIPNYDWNSPVTSRLLLEASVLHHALRANRAHENVMFTNPQFPPGPVKLNGVLEQSTGLNYRATPQGQNTWNESVFARFAASYITGSHAWKIGFNWGKGTDDQVLYAIDSPATYRFNNGVPNRITLRALPTRTITKLLADHGLYVQDKWTIDRATLSLGLRYDYYHVGYPETFVGPTELTPTRNLTFPESDGVRWHELEPRMGLAYDVFGTGKTAVKVSLNRYLSGLATDGTFGRLRAPASLLVNSTNRSWNDANRNFVPDCNLLDPRLNGECGAMDNAAFGSTRLGNAYDPDTLSGWGKRPDYNWQFQTSVQHEILPRVSTELAYYRTWFGGFIVTDDRSVGPEDFDTFSITAPRDPLLPGGGGYTVSGLYDLKPSAFGRDGDLFITYADNYGKMINRVDGFDFTFNVRPRTGLFFQGGPNWERRTRDNCEVAARLPEILNGADVVIDANASAWMPGSFCRQQTPFRTLLKFLTTYTVPKVDVQLSASFQSQPGTQIWANFTATNAIIAPSLGRNLSGGASNISVNIVEPGTMYGDRINQLDLRFGKIIRFGRTRANVGVDLYNALNSNAVARLNQAYATWLRPQEILNHRFAKLVLQLNF
jgi:hypothetical protein